MPQVVTSGQEDVKPDDGKQRDSHVAREHCNSDEDTYERVECRVLLRFQIDDQCEKKEESIKEIRIAHTQEPCHIENEGEERDGTERDPLFLSCIRSEEKEHRNSEEDAVHKTGRFHSIIH